MSEANQQFDTFQQWVQKASSWLTRRENWEKYPAICFDNQGRWCRIGKDFMRARDEDTFPVQWLWPDQVGPLVVNNFPIAESENAQAEN